MKTLSLKYLHLFQSLQTLIDDVFKISFYHGLVIFNRQVVLLDIPKRVKNYLEWQNDFLSINQLKRSEFGSTMFRYPMSL